MLGSGPSFAKRRKSPGRPEGSAIDSDSNDTRRRLPRWLPPLLWAAVILGASSFQDLKTSVEGIAIRDKLAHFGEFFVFGWLVARAFDGLGWSEKKHFVWTVLIGIQLGAVDELYQGFVPGRERSVLDLLADVLGAAAGWYFSREDQAIGHAAGHAPRSEGHV